MVSELEEQRANTAAGNTGLGGMNWDWYKSVSGFGDIHTIRYWGTQIDAAINNNPWRIGNLVHGRANTYQSSENQYR